MSDRREPKDVPTKRKVPDDSRPAKRPRVQDEDLPDLANTSPVLETSNTSPGGSGINTASSPVPALVPSPLAAPVLAGAPVPIDNAQDLGLGADEEEDLPPGMIRADAVGTSRSYPVVPCRDPGAVGQENLEMIRRKHMIRPRLLITRNSRRLTRCAQIK